MLILVVVLVHMLETFYCRTFLPRDVQNLDFCFPVPDLVFLLKTMGFLRFLLRDCQFLMMQHLLPPVISSTLIALSFLLDSLIIPVFVFPFLLVWIFQCGVPCSKTMRTVSFVNLAGHLVTPTRLFLCLTFVPIAARWLFLLFLHSVQEYISSEISLGRVAGPFAAPPFHDSFVVSPLNTVAKHDSNERRVIVDLSWPCGSSVNDSIPSGYFLWELLEMTYPTIDAIVSAIVSLGRGCLPYKRDLQKAYRQFPIDPHDYHLLGYI